MATWNDAGTAQLYLELLSTVAICFTVAAGVALVLSLVLIVSECFAFSSDGRKTAVARSRKRSPAHVKIATFPIARKPAAESPAPVSRVLALAGDPRDRG